MPVLSPLKALPVSAQNLASLNNENKLKQNLTGRYQKNFADIRIKLGDKKSNHGQFNDRDSVPSQISENAWDELPKYEAIRFKEQ